MIPLAIVCVALEWWLIVELFVAACVELIPLLGHVVIVAWRAVLVLKLVAAEE